MKIVLTAFQGKLVSEPMDWPEGTSDRIKLAMDMDNDYFYGYGGEAVVPEVPVHKVGEFTWTGKYLAYPGFSAREYKLIGIW